MTSEQPNLNTPPVAPENQGGDTQNSTPQGTPPQGAGGPPQTPPDTPVAGELNPPAGEGLRPTRTDVARPHSPSTTATLVYLAEKTYGQAGGGVPVAQNNSAAASKDESEQTAADAELIKLNLQVEEYYDTCRNAARLWMTIGVIFLCLSVLLPLAFILSFVITYQRELLTSGGFAGNIVTWRNLRILIGVAFALTLLVMWAARFKKRWKLNQSALEKLAKLKVKLTSSSAEPDLLRDEVVRAIEVYNQALEKQKLFTGPG